MYRNNRGRKAVIQRQAKAYQESKGLEGTECTSELELTLVDMAYRDAVYALQDNANAVGWYDDNVGETMAMLALIHPEVTTDPTADMAFKWALALTSNGLKVDKNFELAEETYSHYK